MVFFFFLFVLSSCFCFSRCVSFELCTWYKIIQQFLLDSITLYGEVHWTRNRVLRNTLYEWVLRMRAKTVQVTIIYSTRITKYSRTKHTKHSLTNKHTTHWNFFGTKYTAISLYSLTMIRRFLFSFFFVSFSPISRIPCSNPWKFIGFINPKHRDTEPTNWTDA